jgi:uncharacterized protein (UPF0332 family)
LKLTDAYISVSERSLESAKALLGKHFQESAMFHAYHSFESVGGAFCSSRGKVYPTKHRSKLSIFKAEVRGLGPAVEKSVAAVAIEAASVRESCLYPLSNGGGNYDAPSSRYTLADATRFTNRVKGIVARIRRSI